MHMTLLLVAQVLLAVGLIGLILVQHGRGADTGASFGSGASSTVFGARGSASFLTRTTAILAILFFSNSFLLAYLYGHVTEKKSLMEQVSTATAPPKTEEKKEGDKGKADVPAVAPQAPAPLQSGNEPVAAGDVPTVKSEAPAPAPAAQPGQPADGAPAPKN